MKTLITAITITLMLAVSAQARPFHVDPTKIEEKAYGLNNIGYVNNDSKSFAIEKIALGYGEISPSTGRPATNRVNGYYRSNGTYVDSYYRS